MLDIENTEDRLFRLQISKSKSTAHEMANGASSASNAFVANASLANSIIIPSFQIPHHFVSFWPCFVEVDSSIESEPYYQRRNMPCRLSKRQDFVSSLCGAFLWTFIISAPQDRLHDVDRSRTKTRRQSWRDESSRVSLHLIEMIGFNR